MKNKIYKLLSIVLTVMLVFSCCSVAFTAFAEETETIPVYYVSATGSDDAAVDGLTTSTPLATVNEAIKRANAVLDEEGNPKYGAGDTVFLKVMGTTEVPWGGTQVTGGYQLDSHSFTLNISSATKGAKVGNNVSVILGGPVDFENVNIWVSSYPNYCNFQMNNHPVNFASDVTFTSQNVASAMVGDYGTPAETTGDLTYNINVPTASSDANYKFSLSIANVSGTKIYGGNITVNYDNVDLRTVVRFSSGSGACTYKKNVNLNIKNASAFTFNASKATPVFEGGALQVVNSAGITLSNIANVDNIVNKYILTNTTTKYKNAFEFTDIAGVFKVRDGYSVTAVKEGDEAVVVTSAAPEEGQDVVLDLREAGTGNYNLTIEKTPTTKVVYVSATGSPLGDGSQENPVSTIREAIKLGAAAGLDSVDTLNIKTIGSAVNTGVIAEYGFNIHVESADSATKTTITVDTPAAYNGTDSYMLANGGTNSTARYSNVNIKLASSGTLSLNNTNAVFDSDVAFTNVSGIYFNRHRVLTSGTTYVGGQTVEFSASGVQRAWLTNGNHGKVSFKDDVNLVVNSTALKYARFTSEYGATVYEKNVNVHVKNASSLAFEAGNSGGATINGALQVIDSAGLGLSSASTSSLAYLTAATQWFITNNTGNKDALSFTETAGKYKVDLDTELWTVMATTDGTKDTVVATEKDGILDLSHLEAGAYTIIKEKNSGVEKTYYVSATGSDSAAGTKEDPLLSIDGLIDKANTVGYGEGDTVYAKVLGTDAVLWKTTNANNNILNAYAFTLDISSDTSGAIVGATNDVVTSTTVIFNGPTKLSNIEIRTSMSMRVGFNLNSVEFGENVVINNGFASFVTGVSSYKSIATTKEVDIVVKSNIGSLNIGNYYGPVSFNHPVTYTLDNSSLSTTLRFGGSRSNDDHVTYNSNINVNIKNASKVSFTKGSVIIGTNPNIQIIDSVGLGITSATTGLTDVDVPKWILNNKTASKDALSFTEIAGVYKVNLDTNRYTVTATSVDGTKVKGVENGILDLSELGADEYNITSVKKTENLTYYVSAAGSDETGDGTKATPYKTVLAVIKDANALGLVATDSVTINVIGTDPVYYSLVDNKNLDETHAYPITVQSVDPTKKGTLWFGISEAESSDSKADEKWISGDMIFDNINIVDHTGKSELHANGYNVTLGEGAVFNSGIIELSEQEKTHTDEQTLIIKNAFTGTIHTSNGNYGAITFKEDVNIIIDNASANPTVGGTPYYGGYESKYEKNLNVIVKQAAGLKFGKNAKSDSNGINSTSVKGAVNLLVPSNIELSGESLTNLNALTTNVYHVVNSLGKSGSVDFAGSTGAFTVKVNNGYQAYVTDDDGTTTSIQGTDLTLDVAGKYIVASDRKSDDVVYYAQAGGTGDGSSAESPLGSVNAVIEKAIEEDWNYESFAVKVMVLGTEKLPWDEEGATTLTAHKFTLIIDSEIEDAKVGNNSSIHMGGNVQIDNIQLCMNGTEDGYPSFALNGYDAVIGENVTADGSYWKFVNGRNSGSCTLSDDQYVTINSALSGVSLHMANAMSAATYNKNLYVTYNVEGGAPKFTFNSSWGDSKYNSNVTIDIVNASGASFDIVLGDGTGDASSQCVFGANAKVQVIDRVGLGISSETAGLSNITDKLWVINDTLGERGILTASATNVGTYTVEYNDTLYFVRAIGANTYEAENSTLSIDLPGTYTVLAAYKQVGKELYVKTGGSSNASGTEDDPFDTVASAIAAANDSGHGAKDTVTIKLMGASVDNGDVPAYEFDLVVISADANTKTTLNVTTNTLTNNEGGYVLFSNVTIAQETEHKYVVLNDSNATFENNVSFNFGYGTVLVVGTNRDDGDNKNVAGNTLIFNNATPFVSLSNFGWAGRTYTEDVNLVVNNASANARIWFNASYLGVSNGTTVYDKNLNINLKDASAASFYYGAGVTVNGGLQIINSTDIAITSATEGIADVTGNKWIINNKLGADSLQFTDNAGTFIIDVDRELYDVYLTDASGTKIKCNGNEKEITLAPGDWELSKVRRQRDFKYTVSTGGELETIGAAINVANEAGLDEWDTLTVTVEGTEPVPWGGVENADLDQQLPAHDFKLIIEAANNTVKVGDETTIILNGPTVFKNITLNFNNSTSLLFDGNDVTIDSTVKFDSNMGFGLGKTRNRAVTANYYEPVNVDVNIPVKYLNISNNYHNANFHEDVNITYNASTGAPSFRFGCNSGATNINADLNFNIKAATGVNFINRGNGYNFGNDAKLQVINSSGVELASDTGELAYINVPKWIITNKTGNINAVSFTENAGTYNLDIGAIKQDGYYAIITNNNATNEVIHAKGDSVTLPAGEYTVTIGRDPQTKEYNITEGTLADAVQTAIDERFGYGDNITFNLGSLKEINIGKLPKYTFNLVIKSDDKTKLVMNESNEIANNQGAHTHFKNVEIRKVDLDTGELGKWGTINLAGSSVTFDSDVVITTGGFCTLTYGVSADNNDAVVVDTEQKVVIDCPAPTYISLSSWNYANRTYNDDVTLVINNRDTDSTILFNAYYDKSPNGTTSYYGNININVKQAKGIKFQDFNETSLNGCVQLLINGNTVTREEDIAALNDFALQEMYYVIDKSFQRGILDFTDEVGVYAVNSEYEASASVKQTFDIYEWAFVDAENGDTATADENNVISIYNNDQYIDDENWMGTNVTNIWELRTNEYFEDFNDTTIDELHDDWMFSSDSSAVTAETELTDDGMLHIVTQHNVKELPALNKNINISSKEQYISMDMKGNGFNYYNGLEILARLGGSGYAMDAYSFHLSNMFISLDKLNGNPNENNQNGYYSYNTNGMETEEDGLWGRVPGGVDKNNTYTFNSNHTYRVSLSVTTDYEGRNEIAYVRGIVVNLTTNQVVFDETFKDSQPYDGTEFAICSPGSGGNVYVDNVYFSTEKFRDGDEGLVEGDINGDGVYNVLDLVYVGEKLDGADHQIAVRNADLSGNGVIDQNDIPLIRKEILGDVEIGKEFNLSGNSDAAANALRQQILNATSTLNGKVYTAINNGEVVLQHTISGNIWYVSSEADGNGDGKSASTPWTLKQLQDNTILDNDDADETYEDCKVRQGDAVLFERGSVFRTDNLLRDVSTSGAEKESYAYLFMSEGTFYGAYTATQGANAGATAKPKFIDSVKNYADADVTWEPVEGQENLYVIDAPELIIDMEGKDRGTANKLYAGDNGATNIVFDGGAKVGQRKAFPDSARNGGKLYTIYKDGQFTTDVVNGKLYLYSANGNPGDIYTSIEVSRPVQAIQVNSHEGNVIIDNLSFHGFANGTIGSAFGTNGLTVTNCDIGYSGGTFMGKVRGGNAIGGWCGGSSYKINHNWIYQTWDSAISPQGNQANSYDGFEVIGNLFEYNNCDIEIFDSGTGENVAELKSATWNNCDWSNNIMRFTTLGWGSREADKIRGIQGVIRGSFIDASVVDVDWTNNIIDSPGMEIFRLDNTTDYKQIDADTTKALGIFKFGAEYAENGTAGDSLFGNNTYYLNARLRKTSVVVREYKTMTDDAYQAAHGGNAEPISRGATTAVEFYKAITVVEDSNLWTEGNSHFFWGGVEVTSSN